MKYRIDRTSDIWGENNPCKSAYKEEGNWYIDINTLEELHELIREVDCKIIVTDNSLEIYDDYRE